MTNKEIIREFSALPPEARRKVEDFIALLRERYQEKTERAVNDNLTEENFVGMWRNREDMRNSSTFVREIRRNEWTK